VRWKSLGDQAVFMEDRCGQERVDGLAGSRIDNGKIHYQRRMRSVSN